MIKVTHSRAKISAPSRGVVEERPKWSFLDNRNAKLSDEQPFIVDRFADWDNFHYDSIYKRHVPTYLLQLKRCLGGNKAIDSAIFGVNAVKPEVIRYFDRKALKRFNASGASDAKVGVYFCLRKEGSRIGMDTRLMH